MYLRNNEILITDVDEVADILESNYTLTDLYLDNNVTNKKITEIICQNKKIYTERRFITTKLAT